MPSPEIEKKDDLMARISQMQSTTPQVKSLKEREDELDSSMVAMQKRTYQTKSSMLRDQSKPSASLLFTQSLLSKSEV